MALLASDVITLAAGAYLNDPSLITYNYVNMLPCVQAAVLELEGRMFENGLSPIETRSATLALTAVTSVAISSTTTPVLPTDLILPISLEERKTGSGDKFVPMKEKETLKDRNQGNQLEEWTWENEQINLIGALVATDVRIIYQKSLAAITASNSPIYLLGSKLFLAARVASLVALTIGNNKEKADVLYGLAEKEANRLITARVKETQSFPARRLPYGYYRRQVRRNQLGRGR